MEDEISRGSARHAQFSHSVFQPTSARSSSTLEDAQDYHNRNYDNGHVTQEDDLGLNLDERHTHGDDVNFNFEANISAKEDLNPNMNDFLSRDALGLNSHDGKSQKLNSLANNMTSQAMSPGTKTSLLDLENAFQNLKHKMPVNQVRRSPQNISRNISEEHAHTHACQAGRHPDEHVTKHVTDAAVKIQRWFRRHRARRKAGES